QPRTRTVFDEDVVVVRGPVVADEHFCHPQPPGRDRCEPEATSSSLMVQCSSHVIPPAIPGPLTTRQAHDLEPELKALAKPVLTDRLARDQPRESEADRTPLGGAGVALAAGPGRVGGIEP